ncbi:hypothetical protein ASG25_10885 [Rhizobium sp. Leaf384]|uniref:hypothetical protein n=1 Tax=Rhizobium sp. Leaf384 TaxID=1736358 RepID=UPI0007157700|nr:hypothetical protein [Rhizobium sp. Leaf384]KQS79082.1 hypothetical protein ASG25_10885 [Rhizobium sp. Leaf384]
MTNREDERKMELRVKPLEWRGNEASSATGHYRVQRLGDKWEPLHNGCYMLPRVHGVVKAFATLDAAQAYAQADYEQRVLSALSTPSQGERAAQDTAAQADVFPDIFTLQDYQPGQWWLEELRKHAGSRESTCETQRAALVAVNFAEAVFKDRKDTAPQVGEVVYPMRVENGVIVDRYGVPVSPHIEGENDGGAA